MEVSAKKPGRVKPAQHQTMEGGVPAFHFVTCERRSGAEVGERRSKERQRKRWVGWLADC
jgi:hypothetical protein